MLKVGGRVRGYAAQAWADLSEQAQLALAPTGDSLIGPAMPQQAPNVALGDSWVTLTAAFTALTAVPTTTGIFGLWNGEPGNGKFYVIDAITLVKIIIDVTTQDLPSLWVTNVRQPVTALTDAGIARWGLSGKNYGGRARTAASVTTVTGRWDVVGLPGQTSGAIGGSAWQTMEANLYGQYIVPPGGMFSFSVSEVTATASKYRAAIRWHEVQLPYVS